MRDLGGKGRVGLWLIAHRNPLTREADGSLQLDGGFMLSLTPSAWLFSFGVKGIGTLGFGWVTKWQRQRDAEHAAAHAAELEHHHARREAARETWESLPD